MTAKGSRHTSGSDLVAPAVEALSLFLRRNHETGSLPILWVGAGASAAAGHPTLGQLEAAARKWVPGSTAAGFALFDAFVAETSPTDLDGFLHTHLGQTKAFVPLHSAMARLAAGKLLGAIFTTNYDELIERALESGGVAKIVQTLETNDALSARPELLVLKLHGSLTDWSRVILSGASYARFHESYPNLTKQLHHAMRTRPVLFVGCSMQDPRVLDWLRGLPEADRTRLHASRVLITEADWSAVPAEDQSLLAAAHVKPVLVATHAEIASVLGAVADRLAEPSAAPPVVAAATPPRSVVAPELSRLLRDGTSALPKHAGPAALLNARHHIVPFYVPGRAALTADIDAWCREGDAVRARLFVGEGGMGKTRLFMEVAKTLRDRGGLAGFLTDDATPAAIDALVGASCPAFVVVDYAESRSELSELMRVVSRRREHGRGAPLRVALVARSAADWWSQMMASETSVTDLLRDSPMTAVPALASREDDRAVIFAEAASAFAAHLGKPVPAAPRLDDPLYDRALYLHIAALMAVEGKHVTAATLMSDVLDHEERFWLQQAPRDARERRVFTADVPRVVTALTLRGGASDRLATDALVESVLGRPDANLAYLLRDLYPGAAPRHVGALEPDLLGEALVLRVLAREGGAAAELLRRALHGADEQAVETAFTVLGRISAGHPEARPWIRAVLAPDVVARALPAFRAAKAVGKSSAFAVLGEELARALEAEGTAEVAAAIEEEAIPDQTVALVEIGVWVMRTRLAALSGGEDHATLHERARLLNNLGKWLGAGGRREAALDSIRGAFDACRKLATARPEIFLPAFAMCLNNLGAMQGDLGERRAALASTQEALDAYRTLAAARPETFHPGLATSLNNLGVDQRDLGELDAALTSTQEAVDIRRKLARERPEAFRAHLAQSLNNLGNIQSDLGRLEAALASTQEAVDATRELAIERPDAFLGDLAGSLSNLGNRQSDLRDREGALASTQEAVEVYRRLTAARPEVFLPDLARCLNNLGDRFSEMGQNERAVAAFREALDLLWPLYVALPAAFARLIEIYLDDVLIHLTAIGQSPDETLLEQQRILAATSTPSDP
jgi:tetratricopeptide (TPR) repeat protein